MRDLNNKIDVAVQNFLTRHANELTVPAAEEFAEIVSTLKAEVARLTLALFQNDKESH